MGGIFDDPEMDSLAWLQQRENQYTRGVASFNAKGVYPATFKRTVEGPPLFPFGESVQPPKIHWTYEGTQDPELQQMFKELGTDLDYYQTNKGGMDIHVDPTTAGFIDKKQLGWYKRLGVLDIDPSDETLKKIREPEIPGMGGKYTPLDREFMSPKGMVERLPGFFDYHDFPQLTRVHPEQDPNYWQGVRRLQQEHGINLQQRYVGGELPIIDTMGGGGVEFFDNYQKRILDQSSMEAERAANFIERQKAIQDFRLSNPEGHAIASELENLSMKQLIYRLSQFNKGQNDKLAALIKENPDYMKMILYQDGLNPSRVDFPSDESFTRMIEHGSRYSPHHGTGLIPTEGEVKSEQPRIRTLSGQWREKVKRAGLHPDEFRTDEISPGRLNKWNTGGFLLGLAGISGELGMISRVLKGGEFMDVGNGVDVVLPSELIEKDGKTYIKEDYDAYINQMAAFHPDNAANHPEITDEMRRKFYKAKGIKFDE